MLSITDTKVMIGEDNNAEGTVLCPPIYTLVCKDIVGNEFEIDTDKGTFAQVTDFLDKLKYV